MIPMPDDGLQGVLRYMDWRLWVAPFGIIGLSALVGMFVENVSGALVRRCISGTPEGLEQQITRQSRGLIFVLIVLLGVNLATYSLLFLPKDTLHLIRTSVFVLAMLSAIVLCSRVAVGLIRFYMARSSVLRSLPNTSLFENIVRITITVGGLVMLLHSLGVEVGPLLAALGVGGLALSLALQDTLSNMIAGIQMILARQIRVGSRIRMENGMLGEVRDIGWRTTLLKQDDGDMVIVPNSKLSTNIIVNLQAVAEPTAASPWTLTVSVPLSGDLQRIEELASGVAREVATRFSQAAGGTALPEPVIRYVSYGEAFVNMEISLSPVPGAEEGMLRHELLKALHARFQAEKLPVALPHRLVTLERALDGSPS